MTDSTDEPEHPGVVFPPPLLFVIGFGIGLLIDRQYPMFMNLNSGVIYSVAIGWGVIGVGLGIMLWGVITFFRFRTAIFPNRPASDLVIAGPYRFTRNPMYVGLTLAYTGGSLVCLTFWPFVFLPLVLWSLTRWVILPEERYLSSEFGSSYVTYTQQVRRWI